MTTTEDKWVLRTTHEALGMAYRTACEELVRLRHDVEDYRSRLHAVRILTAPPLPASVPS